MAMQHPMVGRCFLTLKPDGSSNMQGEIVEVFNSQNGELCRVQYFGWLAGDATSQGLMALDDFLDVKTVMLFDNNEHMKSYHDTYQCHKDKRIWDEEKRVDSLVLNAITWTAYAYGHKHGQEDFDGAGQRPPDFDKYVAVSKSDSAYPPVEFGHMV